MLRNITIWSKYNIKRTKFTHSPLDKGFEKQQKTTEVQVIKQTEVLKALKPEGHNELESTERLFQKKKRRTSKVENKIHEVKKFEDKINRKDLNIKITT